MTRIVIAGVEYPKMLMTETLSRAFGPEFGALWERYKANRKLNVKTAVKPPPEQYQMAALIKAGASAKQVAQQFGIMNVSSVNAAVERVAKWEFMHN